MYLLATNGKRSKRYKIAILGVYLLALFTPISIAANCVLCVCDICINVEAKSMAACDCQAHTGQEVSLESGCSCCTQTEVDSIRPDRNENDCQDILILAESPQKIKLPTIQATELVKQYTVSEWAVHWPQAFSEPAFWRVRYCDPSVEQITTIQLLI